MNKFVRFESGDNIVCIKGYKTLVGQYPIPSKGFEIEGRSHWVVKEEDGYSICLKDEDLSKLRQKRIESLDIN